jgi:ribosomal protein S27E
MRAIDLTHFEHAVFEMIEPTDKRIHKSVAWRVRCKHCGKEQLVGASEVKRGAHARCIYCQIPKEINAREL